MKTAFFLLLTMITWAAAHNNKSFTNYWWEDFLKRGSEKPNYSWKVGAAVEDGC